MGKVFIDESTLTSIGSAIREKEGSEALIPMVDMAERIKALGGSGAEYTTGKLTFVSNTDAITIQHGLSKPPKFFIFKFDDIVAFAMNAMVMAVYTEFISTLIAASTTGKFTPWTSYVPGATSPEYWIMSMDETNIKIATVTRSWAGGDWTWEAWTW